MDPGSPIGKTVHGEMKAALPAKPNRLRIAMASFWNYQEIDTDLVPRGVTPLLQDRVAAGG